MAEQRRQGPRRAADGPRRPRRAVAARAGRRRRDAVARAARRGPPIGVFSLFRLPLGAFRPHDVMYVYDRGGHVAGLAAGGAREPRDEWTVVELDAVGDWPTPATSASGSSSTCCATARSAARSGSTSPAPTRTTTSSCSCRPGSSGSATSRCCTGDAGLALPEPMDDERAADCGIRPADAAGRAGPVAALRVGRRPQPVQRLEACGSRTGSARAGTRGSRAARSRRSCASPTSRLRPAGAGRRQRRDPARRLRPGRRRQGGPAALPQGARPSRGRRGPAAPLRAGRDRAARRRGDAHRQGVLAPVRTYESPVDRRLEEEGFDAIATVTLLMKETLVRVAEPRLVPAGVR